MNTNKILIYSSSPLFIVTAVQATGDPYEQEQEI